MREDYQEQLDKMFPEGYIICYTCKDGQLRMAKYNPKQYDLINEYELKLKEKG